MPRKFKVTVRSAKISVRRRRRTAYSTAKKALNMVRQIKRAEEVKVRNLVTATPIAVSDDGYIASMTDIAGGAGVNNRVGNEVLLKKLHLQGVIQRSPTDTAVATTVKVCLILDRQQVAGSTPPLLTDIWSAPPLGTQDAPFAPFNHTNRGRFQAIRTKRVVLTPDTPARQYKLSYRPRNHKLRWLNGDLNNFRNGTIWIVVISSKDPATPAVLPTFTVSGSLTYTDD